MRKGSISRQLTLLLAVFLGLVGCSSEQSEPKVTPEQPGTEVRSDKQRVVSPQVDPAEVEAQVAGNRDFAFNLYQELRGEEGNLFFSPHSITLALAMLYPGAKGQTEQQMATALSYELPQDKLHPVFNWLDAELQSRGEGSEGADGGEFRLNIVNAIWGQQGYSFWPAYLDTLALNYGAGLRVMDFVSDPEGSRQEINDWVEEQTEQRIKDLLPQGSIDALTRLVLTNAIYFNAAWATAFQRGNTQDGTFTLKDGSAVSVPLMHGKAKGSFYNGDGFSAATLPYDGNELSMLLIVPEAGQLDAVEQSLSGQLVSEILDGLQYSDLLVTLPSFEFEASQALNQPLQQLGMVDAFDPGLADLSGIADTEEPLYVTSVLHKAFIKVNEAGTEAAAATAVVVGTTSISQEKPFVVDKPFIFAIFDHATGEILFVGRVLDPRS